MARMRLLERLNGTSVNRSERKRRYDQRVRESVVAHITRLLNTRRGNVPIDLEFGMPDLASAYDSSGGGSTEPLDRAIADLLTRYEPRLDEVKVVSKSFSASELGIGIEIKGRVIHGSRALAIRVRGIMMSDGRFVAADGAPS